jgi:hypothetical protein
MPSIFERLHLLPRNIPGEVRRVLEARYHADPDAFIDESEALCLVIGDRRWHPHLPGLLPGVGGPRIITMHPTNGVYLGNPAPLEEPVIQLVLNAAELDGLERADVPAIVDEILSAADDLITQDTLQLYPTERAFEAALAALIGYGNTELVLDPARLDLPHAPLPPKEEREPGPSISGFVEALGQRRTVLEAATSARFLSPGMANTYLAFKMFQDWRNGRRQRCETTRPGTPAAATKPPKPRKGYYRKRLVPRIVPRDPGHG